MLFTVWVRGSREALSLFSPTVSFDATPPAELAYRREGSVDQLRDDGVGHFSEERLDLFPPVEVGLVGVD